MNLPLVGTVPVRALVVAVVALVVLVLLVFNLVRCVGSGGREAVDSTSSASADAVQESAQSASADSQPAASSSVSADADGAASGSGSAASAASASSAASNASNKNAVRTGLAELIGEEKADKLLQAAKTDTKALWIASHYKDYDFDGYEVQVKILKLAAEEPQAIPFVRAFPAQYPVKQAVDDPSIAMEVGSPSPDVPDTQVPHFYQWDRRWGNTVYSSAAFGLTGCGPTSFSMVYQGVTGNTDLNPYEMGQLADALGYMSEFNGTDRTFFMTMAGELGMECEEVYPVEENLVEELSKGNVVLARLGPGIFTELGHFFVLTGLSDDGKVILNDPYSYERSSVLWDPETICEEATTFFSYAKGTGGMSGAELLQRAREGYDGTAEDSEDADEYVSYDDDTAYEDEEAYGDEEA